MSTKRTVALAASAALAALAFAGAADAQHERTSARGSSYSGPRYAAPSARGWSGGRAWYGGRPRWGYGYYPYGAVALGFAVGAYPWYGYYPAYYWDAPYYWGPTYVDYRDAYTYDGPAYTYDGPPPPAGAAAPPPAAAAPAATPPASTSCGAWSWKADQGKYVWSTAACAPAN